MAEPERKLGQVNPFNVTKAVDFSDQEIMDFWVDISDEGGFLQMANPTSPMPMLVLGGKGSGKTHLMRYLSYPLQKLRHEEEPWSGILKERYLGIYFRCGGLNAARFGGKGIDDDVWGAVFAYYMELWIGQLVVETVIDAFQSNEEFLQNEPSIVSGILDLFDSADFEEPRVLTDWIATLKSLQKKVNSAVNNSSITRSLDIRILATSGKLTFGIPQAFASRLPSLKNVQFLYLVDEFENLAEPQQKYINTLYREKESPCSFKIGSRLYGVRTFRTFSADEENKEGSEYETLFLDENLRKTKKNYTTFARHLCEKRLREAGYLNSDLDQAFEIIPSSKLMESLVKHLTSSKNITFPHLEKLQKKLDQAVRSRVNNGLKSKADVQRVISNIKVTENIFVEKVNTFLLYQDWYSGKDLVTASEEIRQECENFLNSDEPTRLDQVLSYFKADLVAQLLRDYRQKQLYLGFETFIEMSDGLPRNLLIILKHIFRWAIFNGENPFQRGEVISLESQRKGVREASDWFYHDARMTGVDGELVRASIDRLATLFREIRFSDKPSECSLLAFSADLSPTSEQARESIDIAERWSLLIKIEGGQRDKNSKRVDPKYQINSMLSPRWDLPFSRRGTLALKCDEVNSIFDQSFVSCFDDFVKERVDRMTAPSFGKNHKKPEAPPTLGFERE